MIAFVKDGLILLLKLQTGLIVEAIALVIVLIIWNILKVLIVSPIEAYQNKRDARKLQEEVERIKKERIDEQQYEDVICGDVTKEFINEYLYLYGERK